LKKLIILIVFLICTIDVIGQKEIIVSGIVKDEHNKVLPYIDVLLKNNDSLKSIVAYAITDNLGRYQIIHQTKQSEVFIETSSLIHKKSSKVLKINKNTQRFIENIILSERVEELQSIEIRAAPRVWVKNDTTTFNIEKLTNGSERVVEEILKKLPGVTVNDKGRLKFKGKNVRNVLLDGDNLFNGNYTVGTQNINANHIKGIEAIENFEDNPLLQGLSQNDEVALNLKFGEGVSLSGNAELNYATKNRCAVNTTAIGVSKKLKGFSIASFNTTGNQTNNEQFDAGDFINNLREQNTNGLTSPSYISDGSHLLPENNSVRNKEFFGSLNILPKISETEILRINIDALSDKSLEKSETLTLIGVNTSNPIRIDQSYSNLIKPFYLNSSLMFQKFISSKKSFTTNFKYSKLNNDQNILGIRNDEEQIEHSIFKELFLSNNTSYTYRINQKSAIKIEGLIVYSEKPERLTLTSGIDFLTNSTIKGTKNNQHVYSKKRQIQLLTNYYKKYRKEDKFNLKINITSFGNNLSSSLTNINEEISFKNKSNYTVFLPEVSTEYFFKHKKISLKPILKMKLFSYTYNDKIKLSNQNNSTLLFDTAIQAKYEFDKLNSVLARFGQVNNIPKEENLYTNFILRKNRILQNNELNFDRLKSNNISIVYRYENLFKNTDIRLGFSYEKDDNAYISDNSINNDVSLVTNFLQDNGSESKIWDFSFIKYLSSLRCTFRVNSSYNRSDYFNYFNDSELRFNRSEFWNTTLSIGTSFIGKFLFGNNLTYNQINFSTQGVQGYKNEALTNNFNVAYVSHERLRIDTDINYLLPNINNREIYTLHLNTSINLQNKKKTISYILKGRNLLNQSNQGKVNNSDFSTTTSYESLFERLFLFAVSFKF
jgi:hypothetical protein